MNVPTVFRRAIDGFIIPPRTFSQMLFSAARGAVSLLTQEMSRAEFIDKLDKQIINEGVISQASAGPMMMLSLFHDLQNPLFKQHKFDPAQFLEGVRPALERFHNVSGALENQLRTLHDEVKKKEMESKKHSDGSSKESVVEASSDDKIISASKGKEVFAAFPASLSHMEPFISETADKSTLAFLEHDWAADAEKDPESLSGHLSRMVTAELFNIHQISAKTAFLLQPPGTKVLFKEGSCNVNNVALLSARSFLCVEKEVQNLDEWGEQTSSKYEIIDYDMDEAELKRRKGGVAAQVEVLYDVTQSFDETDDEKEKAGEKSNEGIETTVVSVAVMEGWLNGGPNEELRWRLALNRPAFEFPGIAQ